MSNLTNSGRQSEEGDDTAKDRSSTFAWDFEEDPLAKQTMPLVFQNEKKTSAPQNLGRATNNKGASKHRNEGNRAKPLIIDHNPEEYSRQSSPKQTGKEGRFGTSRANYVRDQLDRGLEFWWTSGELLPLALLRDGLLLLNAGGFATESQRTLLLRSALAYDRGVKTALRHQNDAECVALILAEAAVEWVLPLGPERLVAIAGGNEGVRLALVAELERNRVLMTGEPRRRAQNALDLLCGIGEGRALSVTPRLTITNVRSRQPFRLVLLLLLVVAFVGFALRQQQRLGPPDMVAMPAASYALLSAEGDGAARSVRLAAFFIDRFEVTNRAYRECVEQGGCPWPARNDSATRTDYFTNPTFDDYPVINVTHSMASAFCTWKERRLPSEAEWQAAASVSPTTGRAFRYPWGEAFEPQRANTASAESGDTVAVGTFRPGGDSPSGAVDMAGNAAEWTATLDENSWEKDFVFVKGGSYQGTENDLFVGARAAAHVSDATMHIGFRCAQSDLLSEAE